MEERGGVEESLAAKVPAAILPPTEPHPKTSPCSACPCSQLALVGLEDPLRAEVPAAILQCQASGITVKMLTGGGGGRWWSGCARGIVLQHLLLLPLLLLLLCVLLLAVRCRRRAGVCITCALPLRHALCLSCPATSSLLRRTRAP